MKCGKIVKYKVKTINKTKIMKKVIQAKQNLEAMLQWSDRIGSDETFEIKETIKLLEDEIKGNNM